MLRFESDGTFHGSQLAIDGEVIGDCYRVSIDIGPTGSKAIMHRHDREPEVIFDYDFNVHIRDKNGDLVKVARES
jgi:hypothetical protein